MNRFGFNIEVTAVPRVYQWAEITKIARGRGKALLRFSHAWSVRIILNRIHRATMTNKMAGILFFTTEVFTDMMISTPTQLVSPYSIRFPTKTQWANYEYDHQKN